MISCSEKISCSGKVVVCGKVEGLKDEEDENRNKNIA